jgi:hypothetical protein
MTHTDSKTQEVRKSRKVFSKVEIQIENIKKSGLWRPSITPSPREVQTNRTSDTNFVLKFCLGDLPT